MLAHEQEAPNDGPRGRCLVLTPGGAAAPETLQRVLESRELIVEHRIDAFDALAQLALNERTAPSPELLVLIVVEPQNVDRAYDLAEAASRFAPSAALWQYKASDQPQLSSLRAPEPGPAIEVKRPAPSRPEPARALVQSAPSQPALRLSGIGSELPAQERSADHEADGRDLDTSLDPALDEDQQPLDAGALSDEELTMLLSDDWELGEGHDQPSEASGGEHDPPRER